MEKVTCRMCESTVIPEVAEATEEGWGDMGEVSEVLCPNCGNILGTLDWVD